MKPHRGTDFYTKCFQIAFSSIFKEWKRAFIDKAENKSSYLFYYELLILWGILIWKTKQRNCWSSHKEFYKQFVAFDHSQKWLRYFLGSEKCDRHAGNTAGRKHFNNKIMTTILQQPRDTHCVYVEINTTVARWIIANLHCQSGDVIDPYLHQIITITNTFADTLVLILVGQGNTLTFQIRAAASTNIDISLDNGAAC